MTRAPARFAAAILPDKDAYTEDEYFAFEEQASWPLGVRADRGLSVQPDGDSSWAKSAP